MGIVTGPMNTLWYHFLEHVVTGPITSKLIIKKVFADIMIAPLFDIVFILGI